MNEQEIIEKLKEENPEFRKLSEEHHTLDQQLIEIDKKIYLTPEEELERKTLQKQKLQRKDMMAGMIRNYKKAMVN